MPTPNWGTSFWDQGSITLGGGATNVSDGSGHLSSAFIRLPYGGTLTWTMPVARFIGRYPAFRMKGPATGASVGISFTNGGVSQGGGTYSPTSTSWHTIINSAVFNKTFDTIIITNSGLIGSNVDFDFFYPMQNTSDVPEIEFGPSHPKYASNEGPSIFYAMKNVPMDFTVYQTWPYDVYNDQKAVVPVDWTVAFTNFSGDTVTDEPYTFVEVAQYLVNADVYWDAHLADISPSITVSVFDDSILTLSDDTPAVNQDITMTDATDLGFYTVDYIYFQAGSFADYGSGDPSSVVWTPTEPGTYSVRHQVAYLIGGLHFTFASPYIDIVVTEDGGTDGGGLTDFTWSQNSASSSGVYFAVTSTVDLLGAIFLHSTSFVDGEYVNAWRTFIPKVTGDGLRFVFSVSGPASPPSFTYRVLVDGVEIASDILTAELSVSGVITIVSRPGWTINNSAEVELQFLRVDGYAPYVVQESLMVTDSSILPASGTTVEDISTLTDHILVAFL